jgi:hypothetical protein
MAPQHGHGIDAGQHEPGDHEGGQDHVGGLGPGGRVEDGGPGVDADDPPVADAVAAGGVHPGVRGDHEEGRDDAGHHDGHPGQQVHPGRQPVPAVEVDAQEDGLDEEGEPLNGEGQADDSAVVVHQAGPEHAHLEREDGARHGTHREQHAHGLSPAAGQQAVAGVAGPLAPPLGEQHEQRHPHPQAGHHDVPAQGETHLRPRRHGIGGPGGGYRGGECLAPHFRAPFVVPVSRLLLQTVELLRDVEYKASQVRRERSGGERAA